MPSSMSSSSGGCQRLRVLLLDLVLLLLLPTIDAFRGPMSATKSNIFERKASTDSAGAESLASASESTSSSLDLRDHHRFYIIRHGETDANAADVIQGSSDVSRLTEKGKEQAASLYGGLRRVANDSYGGELRVDAIYCSPLTRARDTLDILRQSYISAKKEGRGKVSVHLPPNETVLSRLREIDFYGWENVGKNELKTKFPAEYNAWREGNPHGLIVDDCYPLLEIWERAGEVWHEIREIQAKRQDENGGGATLLVAHGTLGQSLLSTAFDIDATAFRRNEFPNCGVAEIHWHPSKDRATAWRWCHPLPPRSASAEECDLARKLTAYNLGCLRDQLADIVLEVGGTLPS